MTLTTTSPTSTTPAISETRIWSARDAIAGAFRKPRFAQRPAWRAELFRLARHTVPDLTDAELDAALRAMIAAGNIQARQVNGKTMYHYTHYWQHQDEEARRALPPAFKPNVRSLGLWHDDVRGKTLACVTDRFSEVHVSLFDENGDRFIGSGPTTRAAYRAACREMRLARHTVPDLLRQVDGLQRTLASFERKVAADIALQGWLFEELGRLRARNAELTQENEELKREAVGESLADDLVALIAALTDERDQLRQQVDVLNGTVASMKAALFEMGEQIDDLRAAQARDESELLPF
jgi:hypothetical protein